jgi:hypothetical protein
VFGKALLRCGAKLRADLKFYQERNWDFKTDSPQTGEAKAGDIFTHQDPSRAISNKSRVPVVLPIIVAMSALAVAFSMYSFSLKIIAIVQLR